MCVFSLWCGFRSAAVRGLLLLLGVMFVPGLLVAQETATITGTVMDAESGRAIAQADVEVVGDRTIRATVNAQGAFSLTVPAGTHTLVVSMLGYETRREEGIRVSAGERLELQLTLRSRALILNPIVATVGRGVEQKAVEAPASVAVVNEEDIRERPTPTPLDHLRSVPGVDIASHGIQGGNVVARGFNNIFSGALHMLTDNRIAGIPSLRVNLMHLIPSTDEDIERMEVVLGPGSALYGPNTANGVLHVMTRSPLTSQGTSVSISGGQQSLFHGTVRSSHLLTDDFGVKVSGQYLSADEWQFTDPVEAAARQNAIDAGQSDTRIGLRDFDTRRWSGELRADWRIDPETSLIFQAGRSVSLSSIELTGVGAAQGDDWGNSYLQTRFNRNRLFAQAYLNTSDAGETFTLRDGLPIVDESRLFVSQVQHGSSLGDRQNFTYGVDYIRTMPETGGTIHGRFEDEDQYDEFGVYLQSETGLTDQLNFVAAGRMDWHSELPDPVFSPRAALVFSPAEGQSFRATYNRAFSTPTSVNLFLDINGGPFPSDQLAALGYGLRAQGSAGRGFQFRQADGSLTGMRSPFNPQGADALIPAEAPVMWGLAVGVLQAQGAIDAQTAQFLNGLTPTGGEVGRAYLDVLGDGTPRPLTENTTFGVPPLQESNTTTWEVGYSGLMGDRVLISADVWYSQRNNFVSPLLVTTPLLLLEGQSLAAHAGPGLVQHFMERGVPQAQAQEAAGQILTGMGSLPVGVLSSNDVSTAAGRSDFLVTYQNFGDVSLWGSDLSAQILLDDRWRMNVAGSWVNKDFFTTDEGQQIALNAPTTKLSAGVQFRDGRRGVNAELRTRYNNEFPVLSAVYRATECIDGGTAEFSEPCVESHFLIDGSVGYRLPWLSGASVQLSVQNAFDTAYRSFAGVPEIGRMALLRLRYEF